MALPLLCELLTLKNGFIKCKFVSVIIIILKILLASILPIQKQSSWSGINIRIYQQLSKNHTIYTCYSPLAYKTQKTWSLFSHYRHKLFGVRNNVYFNKLVSIIYVRALKKSIKKYKPDLLLVLGSGSELYAYKPHCPSYLVADANFYLLKDNYKVYTALSNYGVRESKNVEYKSLENYTRIFYSSDWTLLSTASHYPHYKDKLRRINFSSNLLQQELVQLSLPKTLEKIKLLSVGTDYHRKGMDLSQQLAEKLGCNLLVIGTSLKLSKENKEEVSKLIDFYKSSHFLIQLSRADCTPIVINEANSFGLPVITTNVGGISSQINNGVNGYMVKNVKEAHQKIKEICSDPKAYLKLRRTSFKHYVQNLSWDKFEDTIIAEFECTK